ncbi:MAG: hypothetical protein ACJ77K_16530 [Bacteroidia bacterium]
MFLIPCLALAQNDTVYLKKVRLELTVAGAGIFGSETPSAAAYMGAEAFLNNHKKAGLEDQYGLQAYLFNRACIEYYYCRDQFEGKKEAVLQGLRSGNPAYFIQQDYNQNGGILSSYNANLHCHRFGLSANIRLTKANYFQPYAFYAIGTTDLGGAELAFKDYSSNNFYLVDYSFKKSKTSGYGFGIRFRNFSDEWINEQTNEPSAMYGNIGCKIEFSVMNVADRGNVKVKDGLRGTETNTAIDVTKSFHYFTVGIFFGVGSKGFAHKYHRFFSKWPSEPGSAGPFHRFKS